jgi:hypothetical protein
MQHVCCKENFEEVISTITKDQILVNAKLQPEERLFTIETMWGCASLRNQKTKQMTNDYCPLKSTYHRPIPNKFDFNEGKPIIILRDPKSRIISSFLDNHHREGMTNSYFEELKTKMTAGLEPVTEDEETEDYGNMGMSKKAVKRMVLSAKVYSNDSAFLGCQGKMILGYQCSDSSFILPRSPLNQSFISEVKQRLSKFYFIGFFEEYEKSIRLFHAMNNVSTLPSDVELVKTRTTNNRRAKVLSKALSNYYDDPYDSEIYQEGQRLFSLMYEKYCPKGC